VAIARSWCRTEEAVVSSRIGQQTRRTRLPTMNNLTRSLAAAVLITAIWFVRSGHAISAEQDAIEAGSKWSGEIKQDQQTFTAAVLFTVRNSDRVAGEVEFKTSSGVGRLSLHGNVLESNTVVWMTNRIDGNVTYPGLYIGKLDGDVIRGTWQVPSAAQYGRFTLRRVR
jgi:hypothetical protein